MFVLVPFLKTRVLWHRDEPSPDFFRPVRVSWYVVVGVEQCGGSVEASELALCPACAGRGLTSATGRLCS